MTHMTYFSQRDIRWRWKRLGFKFATIGQCGCTLTCLSMVCNKRPDQMNDLLKNSGGFVYGNIINWTTLSAYLPVKFVRRVTGYANADVVATIQNYGFCLVEVDATPIGNPGGRHWVVFIGHQQLVDPWTGTQRSTSVYTPTGYCVLST